MIVTMPAQSVVQKLTYEQNGATITAELVEFRQNGELQPIGEQPPQQLKFENGELVQEAVIQLAVYTFTFELQSAE